MTKDETTIMFQAWCRAESRVPYDRAESATHARALAVVLLRGGAAPRWTDAGGREFWQFVAERALEEGAALRESHDLLRVVVGRHLASDSSTRAALSDALRLGDAAAWVEADNRTVAP